METRVYTKETEHCKQNMCWEVQNTFNPLFKSLSKIISFLKQKNHNTIL